MAVQNFYNELLSLGIALPEILVPAESVDISTWAVVACDQYTSEPGYWSAVAAVAKDRPSALHCILPEIFLESPDVEQRMLSIKRTMADYLARGFLRKLPPGLILVDRRTVFHPSRKGIVLALDLEKYDYNRGTKSLIRPTEDTILERIPPRIKIRREAPLELPHIMILIDNPEKSVIEPLFDAGAGEPPLYDADLMMDGGHIVGRYLPTETASPLLAASLSRLAGRGNGDPLLFAVGDGNHSLATAKAVWEELKPGLPKQLTASHPARFALVEIVNLYDSGIEFEPIHRILTGISPAEFLRYIEKIPGADPRRTQSFAEVRELCADGSLVGVLSAEWSAAIKTRSDGSRLPTGAVQELLEDFLRTRKEGGIDYIHGTDSLFSLCRRQDTVGFLLPPLPKRELFPAVIGGEVLPRKAFSIGEAPEKRFYLEGRRLDGR